MLLCGLSWAFIVNQFEHYSQLSWQSILNCLSRLRLQRAQNNLARVCQRTPGYCFTRYTGFRWGSGSPTGCTDSQGADHSHSNVPQWAGTDPCTTSGSALFRCSDARRSSHAYRTGPLRFFCCCSIHLVISTCWHSTVRKHSHFQTPLEDPSIRTHLVLLCCIKRLCIFGLKGTIQIRYYYYYYYYTVNSSSTASYGKYQCQSYIYMAHNFD